MHSKTLKLIATLGLAGMLLAAASDAWAQRNVRQARPQARPAARSLNANAAFTANPAPRARSSWSGQLSSQDWGAVNVP